MKEFVPKNLQPLFKICRQTLHWLPITKGCYPLKTSPVFIWCYGEHDEDQIYGFPSIDGETIKVASESYFESESMDDLET
jgi:sarcosine oxidase